MTEKLTGKLEERNLSDIIAWIKKETFGGERTPYRYVNYETTEGLEVLSGAEEFKFVEQMAYSSNYSSTGLVIKRTSNVESKRDIRVRHDLPKSLIDPRDPGYGRWNYELEFAVNDNTRKFIGKMKEKDIGIGCLYCYPDFEIKNGEEVPLGTTNQVCGLFHDIFVHYASKRF